MYAGLLLILPCNLHIFTEQTINVLLCRKDFVFLVIRLKIVKLQTGKTPLLCRPISGTVNARLLDLAPSSRDRHST